MPTTPKFDENFERAAERLSTSTTSDGSVLKSILRATSGAGIDAISELYNEALALANEGHYGDARSRLHTLLGLAPSDGDARLLLAKVYVAGQQWRRAVAELDEASQCGTHVPESLREKVIRHLQADMDTGPAREVREQAEILKLRSEARRLRSENAHLVGRAKSLETEATRWAWVATAASLVAILFIVPNLYAGIVGEGGAEAPVAAVAAAEATAPPEQGSTEEATPAVAPPDEIQVRDPDMAQSAEAALDRAGIGKGITVAVRGDVAQLAGTVPTHDELKKAVHLVNRVPGIEKVGTAAVVNLARRDGAKYEVRSGDSLSNIAYRHYGNQAFHENILNANPALGGKAALTVGQTLNIPAIPR